MGFLEHLLHALVGLLGHLQESLGFLELRVQNLNGVWVGFDPESLLASQLLVAESELRIRPLELYDISDEFVDGGDGLLTLGGPETAVQFVLLELLLLELHIRVILQQLGELPANLYIFALQQFDSVK